MITLTDEELRKKAIASMDSCYLEVGTHKKNVVQKHAIPPALRGKIFDQILELYQERLDPKTLIAMGEWLQHHCKSYHESFGHFGIYKEDIDQLKQGEMPE